MFNGKMERRTASTFYDNSRSFMYVKFIQRWKVTFLKSAFAKIPMKGGKSTSLSLTFNHTIILFSIKTFLFGQVCPVKWKVVDLLFVLIPPPPSQNLGSCAHKLNIWKLMMKCAAKRREEMKIKSYMYTEPWMTF